MNKIKICGLAIGVLGFLSGSAVADVYMVDDDGGADFTTITAAVAFASSGDQIFVRAGLYEEGPISLLGKGLLISGALDGAGAVKVRPASKGDHVFEVISGEPPSAMITDLTIEQGQTIDAGAGVRVDNASVLQLFDCVFATNSSEGNGGGVFVDGGSIIVVRDCSFQGNHSDGRGGGLYVSEDSEIAIDGCDFLSNSAFVGGGLCIDQPGDCTVSRCFFGANTAASGAGLNLGASGIAKPGGLDPPLVVSCAFTGNVATLRGGGAQITLYDDPDDVSVGGSAKVLNCTFSQNSAPTYGVIYGGGGPVDTLSVQNSMIWKNTGVMPAEDMSIAPEVNWDHCIIDPDYLELLLVPPVSSFDFDVVVTRDPRFVSELGEDDTAGTGDEDFRVLPGSPAIDSGRSVLTETDDDLGGLSRRIDDPNTEDGDDAGVPPIDIGAHEFDSSTIDGDGYAVWTGDGADNGLLDSDNWFNGVVSDYEHKWIFDAAPPLFFEIAAAEQVVSAIGGLDVASGRLDLQNARGSNAVISFKNGEGALDYDFIRVAPFSGESATLSLSGGLALWSAGVVVGQNGVILQDGMTFRMPDGGSMRLDGANARLEVNSALDANQIRQVGSSTEPALLNLGTMRVVTGAAEVFGDYAQTGTRLDGTDANGFIRMELLGGESLLDISGVAQLAGGVEFPLGQQSPPVEAGEAFTILTAGGGLDGTMFDFALTTGLGGKGADEALFFQLTTTTEFGGGESVVATTVSLDELVSGSPESEGTSASTLSDLIMADIDGDGFEDLVLSVDNGPGVDGSVVVLLNGQTPGGVWAGFEAFLGAYAIPVGKQPRGLDVGYIDNDEDLDVVVTNYESGTVTILINESAVGAVSLDSGVIGPLDADPDLANTESSFPLDVYVKDLDGAPGGLSDILVTNERDGSVWAFQNTSTVFGLHGTTSMGNEKKSEPDKALTRLPPGKGGSVRDEETTGSSDDDGVGSGSAGSPFGVGITMTWTTYDTPPGSAPADLAVADFDDDGIKDIATANEGGDSISILMGTGGGAYDPASTFGLTGLYAEPISISAGDLDADGDIDLVYIAKLPGTGTVSRVLRNTLAGASYGWVMEPTDSLASEDPYLVRTADVDNDGDDDVIALVASPSPLGSNFTDSGPVFGFASTQMKANDPEDSSCPADFDNSGSVDGADLAQLLGAWGDCVDPFGCEADITGDLRVDGADLAILLGEWGDCNGGVPPLD